MSGSPKGRRMAPRGPRAQFVIVTLSPARLGPGASAPRFDRWVEFVHKRLPARLAGRELELVVSCHGAGEHHREDAIEGARDKGFIVQALEELWRVFDEDLAHAGGAP